MQPLVSVMTSIRSLFLAAVKSLLRGKSFIQAMLAHWVSPATLQGTNGAAAANGNHRTVLDFLKDAEHLLLRHIEGDRLRDFARQLKAQFRHGLLENPACMLPSYNHQLPHGREHGQYLALDVGGSTLRVALVELTGNGPAGGESRIVRTSSFKITPEIKSHEGMAFFDWMAARVIETVSPAIDREPTLEHPLPLGLAWSFPLQQTSLKGGLLQGMGKGFLAANGLLGLDLGNIIQSACKKQGLHVELAAIINDSAAALLSQAYLYPSTRFGLILGTGVNIAVHLPIPTVGRQKFGNRADSWFEKASHVIINTELGMFGNGILPRTRWDVALNEAHPKPDFQPLEYLVSGQYLGEMCRLAIIEAIDTTGIFGGVVPPDLLLPYSLDTETLSIIETDSSSAAETAISVFASRHPSPVSPTASDIAALRTLASFVTRRSAAILAASVFALWELKAEAEEAYLQDIAGDLEKSDFVSEIKAEMGLPRTTVGFNGSVIEFYPEYQANCQGYIDALVAGRGSIDLVPAKESSLLGAAVALACLEEGKAN